MDSAQGCYPERLGDKLHNCRDPAQPAMTCMVSALTRDFTPWSADGDSASSTGRRRSRRI
jgi:hypothetical protein